MPRLDPRQRKTVIARAQKYLNKTLTEQWENFNLEDRKSLKIRLVFHEENGPEIGLEIVEETDDGDEYFFGIKDRSKGFFWFFNFVMRLEFHPKRNSGDGRIIYLLDEPGSYLHARAQGKLCEKLRDLGRDDIVFFCTHSHYLLNPRVIPFNSIRIPQKDAEKRISVNRISEYETDMRRDAAFQPILEALQVRPAAIDAEHKRVVVVEGIYDFFVFDMLGPADVAVIPAVSADSIRYHIAWLLAWGVDYRALWDNDPEGKEKLAAAKDHFGARESQLRFHLLPLKGKKKKRRLEDLIPGEDLAALKQANGLPTNTGFNKTIAATYYSEQQTDHLATLSTACRAEILSILDSLWTSSPP